MPGMSDEFILQVDRQKMFKPHTCCILVNSFPISRYQLIQMMRSTFSSSGAFLHFFISNFINKGAILHSLN